MEPIRTSELILEPFLDTTHTPEEKNAIRAELARRGYHPLVVLVLRVLAAPGLWWQLFAWEWVSLTFADVMLGYGSLFVLGGVIVLLGSALWWDLVLVGAILAGAGSMMILGSRRASRRGRQSGPSA